MVIRRDEKRLGGALPEGAAEAAFSVNAQAHHPHGVAARMYAMLQGAKKVTRGCRREGEGNTRGGLILLPGARASRR